MNAVEALPTMQHMLDAAGVMAARPDPRLVWSAFKDFARVPIEDAEDGLLYEIGVYGFGEPEAFQIAFTRQFTFYEEGEYDRMEQLRCVLRSAICPG